MTRLTIYLKMRVYHMIMHVFGKVEGPTPTGDLHDEYFKNFFECSHISLKITNSHVVRDKFNNEDPKSLHFCSLDRTTIETC